MCPETLGEFDLIYQMTASLEAYSDDLIVGVGDDCAVIARDEKTEYLLTSDLLVERIHFTRQWFLPEQIGSKALRASLSDIAAMGGKPLFALVSLAIPPSCDTQGAESLFRGIRETASEYQVTLAGGDLSRTEDGITIDMMLLGTIDKGRAVLRSGARPGHRIFVSGTLGEAALGLEALRSGLKGEDAESVIQKQISPEPRLALGHHLSANGLASSMIDLSDGLSSDLGHLCKASEVGARIHGEALPLSGTSRDICQRLSLDGQSYALHGGEDYELLFTVPVEAIPSLRQQDLPVTIAEIGEILPASEGLVLESTGGQRRELRSGGYDHFKAHS